MMKSNSIKVMIMLGVIVIAASMANAMPPSKENRSYTFEEALDLYRTYYEGSQEEKENYTGFYYLGSYGFLELPQNTYDQHGIHRKRIFYDDLSFIRAIQNPEYRDILKHAGLRGGMFVLCESRTRECFQDPEALKAYLELTWPLVKVLEINAQITGSPTGAFLPGLIKCLDFAHDYKMTAMEQSLKAILADHLATFPYMYIPGYDLKTVPTSLPVPEHAFEDKNLLTAIAAVCKYLPEATSLDLLQKQITKDEAHLLIINSCYLRLGKGTDKHRQMLIQHYKQLKAKALTSYDTMQDIHPQLCEAAQWMAFTDDAELLKILAADLGNHRMMYTARKYPVYRTYSVLQHRTIGSAALSGLSYLDRFNLRPATRQQGHWPDYTFCMNQLKAEGLSGAGFEDMPWLALSQAEYCQQSQRKGDPGFDQIMKKFHHLSEMKDSSVKHRLQSLSTFNYIGRMAGVDARIARDFVEHEPENILWLISHPQHYHRAYSVGYRPSTNFAEALAPIFACNLLKIIDFNGQPCVIFSREPLDTSLSDTQAEVYLRTQAPFKQGESSYLHYILARQFFYHKEQLADFMYYYVGPITEPLHPDRIAACTSWNELLDLIPTEYPNVRIIFREKQIIFQAVDPLMQPYPGKTLPECKENG